MSHSNKPTFHPSSDTTLESLPDTLLSAPLTRRRFGALGLSLLATGLSGCFGGGGGDDDSGVPAGGSSTSSALTLDTAAKAANPDDYTGYEWYKWTFKLDPSLDTVGAKDGIGQFYIRLFKPKKITAGTLYPLVANLGGLANDGNIGANLYARNGSYWWANDHLQAKYPCYIFSAALPWEACVNYEAETEYMFQFGEAIKAIATLFGNVDMSHIYATGVSQGAGWSYGAVAAQPDLFAAMFLNSGTIVHTTWGNHVDISKLMDVNIYMAHGSKDTAIPPNEAYRIYNALRSRGKTNIRLDVVPFGHGLLGSDFRPTNTAPYTKVYPWQDWLFAQKKGTAFAGPVLNEQPYAEYLWAGRQCLADVATWATDVPYATWIEAHDNPTWTTVKNTLAVPTVAGASTGKRVIGRFRIGDEGQTTYDDAATSTTGLSKGQTLCMTIQGYTGGYGDDLAAFYDEWDVDWAIMQGQVTSIGITADASPTPIARPSSVNLTNGGGPNVNNSLATPNVLDGKQVYLKISLADAYTSGTLKVYVRFTRRLGALGAGSRGVAEFASYWHLINLKVI